MRTTIDVREATLDDEREVVAALSAAFPDDPVFAWIYPHEARRRNLLRRLLHAVHASDRAVRHQPHHG